jgi:DNA-directed RNA polymerase specialized sigma24 family protein
VSDGSTTVLQGQLERAVTGDAEARQRQLELTRDRLMRHARRFLHGRYARLEALAQTDDVVQQLYVKILQNPDRFWVNARGEPVRSLAEFFGRTSAWMRDVLCDQLRKAYGRDDDRPAVPQALAGDVTEAFARLDGCGADAELIALAKACLAPAPEARPADAAEVAGWVKRYPAGRRGQPQASRRPGRTGRRPAACRYPAPSAVAAERSAASPPCLKGSPPGPPVWPTAHGGGRVANS